MSRCALRTHGLTVAWAILLGLLILLPAGAYDPMERGWLDRLLDSAPWIDKLTHWLLFAVMALLARRSLALAGARRSARWAMVTTAAYGLLLEILQLPIPGRCPGALDMIANTVGAVCGAIIPISPGRSAIETTPDERAPNGRGRAPLPTRRALVDPAREEPEP